MLDHDTRYYFLCLVSKALDSPDPIEKLKEVIKEIREHRTCYCARCDEFWKPILTIYNNGVVESIARKNFNNSYFKQENGER